MYVIAIYDVNAKRDAKMLKLFRQYLFHVQGSVFEGELTPSKLNELEIKIQERIKDKSDDKVLIYKILSPKEIRKDSFGNQKDIETIIL